MKSKCLCMTGKSPALSNDFSHISFGSTQTVHLELLLPVFYVFLSISVGVRRVGLQPFFTSLSPA